MIDRNPALFKFLKGFQYISPLEERVLDQVRSMNNGNDPRYSFARLGGDVSQAVIEIGLKDVCAAMEIPLKDLAKEVENDQYAVSPLKSGRASIYAKKGKSGNKREAIVEVNKIVLLGDLVTILRTRLISSTKGFRRARKKEIECLMMEEDYEKMVKPLKGFFGKAGYILMAFPEHVDSAESGIRTQFSKAGGLLIPYCMNAEEHLALTQSIHDKL